MEKIDRETAEELREGDAVARYVESEGWARVKEILKKRIDAIDSISTLPNNLSFEEAGKQMLIRLAVIDFIEDFVSEVEGLAEQNRQQSNVVGIIMEEQIVRTYSSPS